MSVLIATPCYGGMLSTATFHSFVGIAGICGQLGIEVDFLVTNGESAITRGRSNLAATFMKSDRKTLAMIDADIQIVPEDFVKLLRLDKPIRGAAVCLKTPDRSESLSCFRAGKQVKRAGMPSEAFEVDFIGGAVMFVDRRVIEDLSSIDMLKYRDPIIGDAAHIFWERIVDGVLLSEDYAFCSLARERGFSVWCEPSVIVTHYGQGAWRA